MYCSKCAAEMPETKACIGCGGAITNTVGENLAPKKKAQERVAVIIGSALGIVALAILAYVFINIPWPEHRYVEPDYEYAAPEPTTPVAQTQAAPAQLSLSEIRAAYDAALEAAKWFGLHGLPIDPDSATEDFWFRVNHPDFSAIAELEAYLATIFTPHVVDELLSDTVRSRLRETNGVLYTQPADRGTNIFVGEQRSEIIRVSDYVVIYRRYVDMHEMWDDDTNGWVRANEPQTVEIHDFILTHVNGSWLFANFWLVV